MSLQWCAVLSAPCTLLYHILYLMPHHYLCADRHRSHQRAHVLCDHCRGSWTVISFKPWLVGQIHIRLEGAERFVFLWLKKTVASYYIGLLDQ